MQAVLNILSNAIKYTSAGGRVTVRTGIGDHGGLDVTIADDGIGIAPHEIDRALAPFVQADGGLNRRFEGTGLGLPLAKAYVELHGGRLRVDSQVGIEAVVVGEGVSIPMRLVFDDLPAERRPKSAAAVFSASWQSETEGGGEVLHEIVDRWRRQRR